MEVHILGHILGHKTGVMGEDLVEVHILGHWVMGKDLVDAYMILACRLIWMVKPWLARLNDCL